MVFRVPPRTPAPVRSVVAAEQRTDVRVVLARAATSVTLVVPSEWQVATPQGRKLYRDAGPLHASRVPGKSFASFVRAPRRSARFGLPCTLQAAQAGSHVGLDSLRYRGALIVAPDGAGALSVVNLVPIEQYLRGVVPLELGYRGEELIEALKAQAVAARTYAYRKMTMRRGSFYDLAATVADQVYGGVPAENPIADRAVRETAGLILTYENKPIVAYYHSTCGGRTAAVEQVWGKPPEPYLRSVDDLDPRGVPYCVASRYSSWTYTWKRNQLSSFVTRYGQSIACDGGYGGTLERITVISRWPCGRVQRVRVAGSDGSADYCGDKARFALRRPEQGSPILPSARFDIVKQSTAGVTVRGSGYGHGVGMCQMGALGRAAAGQSFERILAVYYTGAELRQVAPPPQASR